MAYERPGTIQLGRGTLVSGADMSAKQGLFGVVSSSQLSAVSSANEGNCIVLDGGTASGDHCSCGVGVCGVLAGEAIAVGQYITSDSSGNAVVASTGGDYIKGIALSPAAASGDEFDAFIYPAYDDAVAVPGTLTLTAGTEATNVIDVTVASSRPSGTEYVIEGYEATMIEAVAAALTLAETGAGAEVSTTANARLVFTVGASGAATISATDAAGASGKTFQLLCYPSDGFGPAARVAITFD